MGKIFSILLTSSRYNIYSIYKTFELNMLIHLNRSTKIFIYKNHFISISNQIHFNCFHSGYQITNSAQLRGTSQMGGSPQMFLFKEDETKYY